MLSCTSKIGTTRANISANAACTELKKGAAGKAQTRMHGAAEKANEDRVAQRGQKQSQVQEPPWADESSIHGVCRL